MKFIGLGTVGWLALSLSCAPANLVSGETRDGQRKDAATSATTKHSRHPPPVIGATGIALTPRNFPRHTAQDVTHMLQTGKELGNYAVFIYQWSQPDLVDVATRMTKLAKDAGYTPILAISPTVLSGTRGQWDAPAEVKRRARGNLRFQDKAVYESYIKAVLELADLKPPYLCLATEINLLAISDIQQYITFAHVYKKLYPVIKKKSPHTKVFVSFQYDFMHLLDTREPGKIKEHTKLIDIFRPELDLIALTTYPADHFPTPDKVPSLYYEDVYRHIGRDEEVMYMEVGWPSTGQGNEQEQVEFINRLPKLLEKVRPAVLAWSLLHDVRISALSKDLAATGLITPEGQLKPAFQAFQKLRD